MKKIGQLDRRVLRRTEETLVSDVSLIASEFLAGFQAVHVKAALEILGMIPRRTVRLPYVPATDDEVDAIRDALRAAGLLDAALT